MIEVLNGYAGLGGNRALWPAEINGEEVHVTAVENDPEIAAIYQERFPRDRVIVCDCHEYVRQHYKEFDFIWLSPPCPTHSRVRLAFQAYGHNDPVYPDLTLWQEIIFLKHHCKGKWVVENVIPYYEPFLKPSAIRDRHCFWSSFQIATKGCVNKAEQPIEFVTPNGSRYGFSIAGKKLKNRKDKLLRNMVDPKLGLFVWQSAFKIRQEVLA